MKRFENWPALLTQFLAEREGQAFAWGTADCMLFCADAVLQLTGEDLADAWRGSYRSEAEAAGIIAQFGSSVADLLDAKLGPRKLVGFAQRGDIVVVDAAGLVSGGVVDETGRRIAVFVDGQGLRRLPLRAATAAWGY